MAKGRKHIHKYHRIASGSYHVWACAFPDCNHFMPVNMAAMIPGKASVCYACFKQFILDDENMSYAVRENNGEGICNVCISKLQGTYVEPKVEKSVAELIQEIDIENLYGK